MEQYVLVILTADDCPHCHRLKSTGNFSENFEDSINNSFAGHKWNADFFFKCIAGTHDIVDANDERPMSSPQFVVYNIDIVSISLAKSIEYVNHFTRFFLDIQNDEVNICRERVSRSKVHGSKRTVQKFDEENPRLLNIDFNDVIKQTFPESLKNYFGLFPCFAVFNVSEWNKGILDSTYAIHGAINGVSTIRKNDIWTPNFMEQYRPMEPISFLENTLRIGLKKEEPKVKITKVVCSHGSRKYTKF